MQFSHFDCVLPNGRLLGARSDRCGGQPPGVQVRPPDYETWQRQVLFTLPVSQEKEDLWQVWLHNQLGKPYDKIGILDFVTGESQDRNWRDETAWFCDELVLKSCEVIGLPMLYIPAYRVTPNSASVALSAWGFGWKVIKG